MLYSHAADIGFAHYPKTAGHSLTRWFTEAFPDAALIEKHPLYEVNHLSVRDSLERLGIVRSSGAGMPTKGLRGLAAACSGLHRRVARILTPSYDSRTVTGRTCATRIVGVVREPFEMLVSLYEYWRSYDFPVPPTQPLILLARNGSFRDFLAMAVVDRGVQNYHDFFDMDGPAAANTWLLDFQSLERALMQVCRELDVVPPAAGLGLLNAGPRRQRNLDGYRSDAGDLVAEVRSYFRWYYEEGVHLMIRGTGQGTRARGDARREPRRWFFSWNPRDPRRTEPATNRHLLDGCHPALAMVGRQA